MEQDLQTTLLDLLLFRQANVVWVIGATALLSISAGLVGCFAFLRKSTLAADAIAHAVLPGVCLAFMIGGTKNPVVLLIGAFVTGWLSIMVVSWLKANTKLKEDTAIAVVLSVFFGFGILLMTHIQQSGNAAQSGLDKFLFGKAAALIGVDVYVFGSLAVALILMVLLLMKEFTLLSFDRQYAQSLGMPVVLYEIILSSMTVLAVVVGIQAVGVVLMAAMLITPAAAARYWTHSLPVMLVLAATFGLVSGAGGAMVSYLAPGLPTGPCMVLLITLIAILSILFAPRRGVIAEFRLQRRHQIRILRENILKAFYQLAETDGRFDTPRSLQTLLDRRSFSGKPLDKMLRQMVADKLLSPAAGSSDLGWILTPEGTNQGRRIVRLHRLWELYLTTELNLAPDHVHDDAETVEHILTPELEARLEQLLNFPDLDPHGEAIPKRG